MASGNGNDLPKSETQPVQPAQVEVAPGFAQQVPQATVATPPAATQKAPQTAGQQTTTTTTTTTTQPSQPLPAIVPKPPQTMNGKPDPGTVPPGTPVPQRTTQPAPSAAQSQQPQVQTPPQGQQPLPIPGRRATAAAARASAMGPGEQRPASGGAAGGMISLNFDDADVFSVIQTIFGEVLRVNYVVDSRVKGRVTFRSVAPVAKNQVLPIMEVIMRLNGIGIVEDSNLYRIVPLTEVSREPSPVSFGRDPEEVPHTGKAVIQVVPIKYLQSTEVVKLITPFLSSSAVILDIPKSSQIIVVDTDASIRRMLQLVNTFDNEKQKAKRAQVFVYPVQNGKAVDISNLLQQIFLGTSSGIRSTTTTSMTSRSTSSTSLTTAGRTQTTPSTTSPSPTTTSPTPASLTGNQAARGPGEMLVSDVTRIYPDEIRNSIIILATPEDYDIIQAAIKKIDTTPRQVLIEGLIAEVNLTDDFTLGLAYAFKTRFYYHGSQITGNIGVNVSDLAGSSTTTSGSTTTTTSTLPALTQGFSYVGVDSTGNASLLVNAIATNSKSKTLAAPHILVSDNREAHIQVGSQVPITTSTTVNSTIGIGSTSTIQYKDIGIILKIKPQVNESGLVALEMSQEISALGDSVDLGNGQKEITINKTEAATSLVVNDGQTIIIGGLIREDHSKGFTGVPWLSKIPVLGYLFGSTTTKKIRNETIIFLTPHVIRTAEQARSVTSDYMDRVTDSSAGTGGLKREEILRGGVLSGSSLNKMQPKPQTQSQSPQSPSDYRITISPGDTPNSPTIPLAPQPE